MISINQIPSMDQMPPAGGRGFAINDVGSSPLRYPPRVLCWMFTLVMVCLLVRPALGGPLDFQPVGVVPPAVGREYRAAWVASVSNIDWPSTNSLIPQQQRAELIAILDRASRLKLNAIFLQVRPGCDALYSSKFEPWSEYLTGTMGKAPSPFYDPLEFAVREAHKRGIELHAWFNPYRARHASAKSPIARNHISERSPNMVRHYGRSLWLDPGERAVQDYSLAVVMDVVKRYDIDGVHFDDYFYPYKERDSSGRPIEFPDEASWQKYGAKSGLARDDWRRRNVSQFVERVHDSIRAAKPWVRFGISPFGIWRPGQPSQIRGLDAWAELYADSRKWLESGWVDYFVPQLYWSIDSPQQSFPVLLGWWTDQNPKGRMLLAGMDATKVGHGWKPEEILRQISITRQRSGVAGHVHWNMKSLMRRTDMDDALLAGAYKAPALVPALTWAGGRQPAQPQLRVSGSKGLEVSWKVAEADKVSVWILQTRSGSRWQTKILPAGERSCRVVGDLPDVVAITAVNRFGITSRPVSVGSPRVAP